MTIESQAAAFGRAMDAFFKKIEGRQVNLQLVFRKIMAELFDAIVLATPVDTGQARAGWRLTGGGLDFRMTLSSEGSAQLQRAPAIGAQRSIGALPSGPRITYTFENAVFHIVFLEMGSSSQAPNGMVRNALAIATQKIRAAARQAGARGS